MKVFSVCLLGAYLVVITGCHGKKSTSPAVVEVAQARVVHSAQQQVAVTIRSTGTVHARETAIVSAQVVGRIQQVLVREGDLVRAGQTLIVIDEAALRASMDQAQAGVRAAQSEQAAAQTDAKLAATTLERYRQLEAQRSVSPQEMDEVAQRAAAASSRLEGHARKSTLLAPRKLAHIRCLAHPVWRPACGCCSSTDGISGGRWRRPVFLYFRSIRRVHFSCKPRWTNRQSPRFARG